MEKIKQETIPNGYEMVSFDTKSLFTNVDLEKTIIVTLERICDRKEINTQITSPEMKELLIFCTKIVHITFDNQVYQQNDGVTMGPSLGPLLAGIFIVKLETRMIPILANMILNWRSFVDDTIGYVKNGSIDIILSKLNSLHTNIPFTYQIEEETKLALDVLLIRNRNFIEIKVYRKPTNNDIYLNWNSFAPNTWKCSTLRKLIKRASLIYSSEIHIVDELKHLEYVCEKYNNFLKWVADQLLSEVQLEDCNIRGSIQDNQNDVQKIVYIYTVLSYAGQR